jgi:DNA-binding transcriptional LysR family regulator
VDASDLKVFEAVARLGSMNRAALELNTVQSNVTTKIRQLELELGVQLFQRQARGVLLTPAGQRLLPFPRQMSKLVSDAKAAARKETAPSGQLEIGSLDTTASWRLPSMLANFAGSYPSVRLVVRTGTTASLTSDVLDCQLDAAVAMRSEKTTRRSSFLLAFHFRSDFRSFSSRWYFVKLLSSIASASGTSAESALTSAADSHRFRRPRPCDAGQHPGPWRARGTRHR